MSDTTNWIVIKDGVSPYEIPHTAVEEALRMYGEVIHLVPTRVWRDYEKTRNRLADMHQELRSYNRATMVVHAVKPGIPLAQRKPNNG